jgi:hypothetical protein
MEEIHSVKGLKQAIRQLESDQKKQAGLLKNDFNLTVEILKPKNLIRLAFEDLVKSPLVVMIGIETIKSYTHRLIDRLFHKPDPAA